MQPTTATTEASRDPIPGRFTIRNLLIWTFITALPLACFRQYYTLASSTVDQRTTPLVQATPLAILFFGLGVISIMATVSFLAVRRKFLAAGALAIALTLCASIGYPWLERGIIHPQNGDPQAARLHNDAAALTATGLKFYYQRHGTWPKSWSDLDSDLRDALLAQRTSQANSLNSLPNIPQALTIEQLPELVDIDFKATPESLSKQVWFEFTGIRPHKPSYNLYREEFQELIEALGGRKE